MPGGNVFNLHVASTRRKTLVVPLPFPTSPQGRSQGDVPIQPSANSFTAARNVRTDSMKNVQTPPSRHPPPQRTHFSSNDAAIDLILLDTLEQRLEIPFAEAFVALALDQLEEDRADDVLREDLQQHA